MSWWHIMKLNMLSLNQKCIVVFVWNKKPWLAYLNGCESVLLPWSESDPGQSQDDRLTVNSPYICTCFKYMFSLHFKVALNQHFCQHLRGTLVNKNKLLSLLLLRNTSIIVSRESKLQYCKSFKYWFLIDHNTWHQTFQNQWLKRYTDQEPCRCMNVKILQC